MKFLIIFFSALLFANVGKITDIKGNVKILRGQETIKATLNIGVDKKDTVITYDNSKAKIVFKDKTIISIGENSSFKIKDYLFNNKPKAKFSFLKGSFVSMTGKIGKIAPKRFKLETKNASIGIRGTIVFGEIKNKKDIVGCSQGLIAVSNNNKVILVREGEMVDVFEREITSPEQIPMPYLKEIINNLSLKREEIKTFFGKVYNSNIENKLNWNDYRKIEKNDKESIIKNGVINSIKKDNIGNNIKEYDDKLFFENLKNENLEEEVIHKEEPLNDSSVNEDNSESENGSTNEENSEDNYDYYDEEPQ